MSFVFCLSALWYGHTVYFFSKEHPCRNVFGSTAVYILTCASLRSISVMVPSNVHWGMMKGSVISGSQQQTITFLTVLNVVKLVNHCLLYNNYMSTICYFTIKGKFCLLFLARLRNYSN